MKKLPDARTLLTGRVARVIALVLLLCAAAGAGFYGWRYYAYRQGPQYAFEQLRQALHPAQPEKLAKLVDFYAITASLATATREAFPFLKQGEDQDWEIGRHLETSLLGRFLNGEKGKVPEKKSEEGGEEPLAVLPPDFVSQLASSLTLKSVDEGSALLQARIRHPQLEKDYPLLFRMSRGADGWHVRELVNARELPARFGEDARRRQAAILQKTVDKNAATAARMNEIMPIESCQAQAGLLSDGRTLLVMVYLRARNQSDVNVNNMTLSSELRGERGPLLHRHLNLARQVKPGENFEHRFSIELDARSPEGRAALLASRLGCRAAWRSMGLGNSQVLHVSDNPDPAAMCAAHGGEHPEVLCSLPFFSW